MTTFRIEHPSSALSGYTAIGPFDVAVTVRPQRRTIILNAYTIFHLTAVQSTTASSDVEHFTGLISDFYELWCNIYSFIRLSIYAKLLSTKEFKCVIHRNAAADWLVFHVTSPKLLHVDGVGDWSPEAALITCRPIWSPRGDGRRRGSGRLPAPADGGRTRDLSRPWFFDLAPCPVPSWLLIAWSLYRHQLRTCQNLSPDGSSFSFQVDGNCSIL